MTSLNRLRPLAMMQIQPDYYGQTSRNLRTNRCSIPESRSRGIKDIEKAPRTNFRALHSPKIQVQAVEATSFTLSKCVKLSGEKCFGIAAKTE